MAEPPPLFPGVETVSSAGVLPSQALRRVVKAGEIGAAMPIDESQYQPASLDLRLGEIAYRVNASFLPGPNATVAERLRKLSTHSLSLVDGAVLERGCVYIIPLLEHLRLRARTSAHANPKSSIGRLDIFARVINDRGVRFDKIPAGYDGPLYVEVAPRTFGVRAKTGSKLVQIRLRRRDPSEHQERRLQDELRLAGLTIPAAQKKPELAFSVDTVGAGPGAIIGYRARKNAGIIDVDTVAAYDPRDYWEPLYSRNGSGIVLDPEDFYILASKEAVKVPPDHAAEMLAYDTLVGEFRVHYAGFFDPGFGSDETAGQGTRAVLEVRSHEVPFMIEDGQTVGRLVYEKLTEIPDTLYGSGVGSYQRQGLALAKHFKPWPI
jgi:dCTP deaminase